MKKPYSVSVMVRIVAIVHADDGQDATVREKNLRDDAVKTIDAAFFATGISGMQSYKVETVDQPERAPDFEFIKKYLHFDGAQHQHLTHEQHMEAMELADGYGKQTAQWLRDKHMTWDWSHVRDSNNHALLAIESYLVGLGCQ